MKLVYKKAMKMISLSEDCHSYNICVVTQISYGHGTVNNKIEPYEQGRLEN